MTRTEEKLMKGGCPELPGYADLEKVLTITKITMRSMSCTGKFGFPKTTCRGRFDRKAIADFIDKEPGNRRYARFATEIVQ